VAKGKLTPMQERFVEEYLKDLNATQAAARAGYKEPNTQGPRLLVNVGIAAAIQEAKGRRSARTEVTVDYVVTNLTEVVERCMERAPVMARGRDGWEQAKDDEGRHIWQFNAKGALGALGLLGKHLGMFVEKHEHTGKGGGPMQFQSLSNDELNRRIAAKLARLATAGPGGAAGGTGGTGEPVGGGGAAGADPIPIDH
jgi:phage terminase small subunit